ncbi:MAG: response regulator [Planctomycetes bacterium]|nr:response regulator [Planctomycetota bacterium]
MTVAKDASRLLIVDDMEASRLILAQILTLHGYQVDTADGGDSALELASEHTYHLAILDYRMPKMNGVELFERLRLVQPSIIGIFLTGYPTVDTVYPAISSGVERVLAKPVDVEELLGVVKQLLTVAA